MNFNLCVHPLVISMVASLGIKRDFGTGGEALKYLLGKGQEEEDGVR